jgi:23S rRNA (guanosine2251-2'-O)-methyltransferase
VPNIARVLDELKKLGYWVIGTVLEGGKPLAQVDLTGNLVLVVGSEGKGLRRITRESCDFFATIPMLDKSLGFNVSVATGICLYEIQRQRELAT